ncbi:MAG: hypothetical protein ACT4OZ_16530 [Gemmatimonadota bacterium]
MAGLTAGTLARRLRRCKLPTWRLIFGAFAVTVAAEYLAASHVVVSIASTVGILVFRGLLLVVHVTPPAVG